MIVSWPGQVNADEVTNALTDFSDFLPTFAELAHAPLPAEAELSGQSFASQLLSNVESSSRRWVFSEKKGRSFVRTDRWKLFRDGTFFDMETDPQEIQPLRQSDLKVESRTARKELQQVFSHLFESSR